MTVYAEKSARSLLTNATDADGDAITVRRINGQVITAWPHVLTLPSGRASVSEAGAVSYNDLSVVTGHPPAGQSAANGSFTFNLWDGIDESPTYVANVQLNSISTTGMAPPTPTYTVWDFDDQAIDSANGWDTTTNVSSFGGLGAAIKTAMQDAGSVANPKYHDVIYTGGPVNGNRTIGFSQSLPVKGSVYIRVRPQTLYQSVTGEIQLASGISDVKWVGWQVQPDKTAHGDPSKAICFRFNSPNKRMAWRNCRMGHWWKGATADAQYPEGIGGSNVRGVEFSVKDCDFRRVFQAMDTRHGYYHCENNFITNALDDFIALTVRGGGLNYLYAVRNIMLDMEDNPNFSGFHTDFIQTGTTSGAGEKATDAYHIECHQNIYIGDNYQQYPTHGLFSQTGGPAGNASPGYFKVKAYDNVFLCTGLRGIEVSSQDADLRRNLLARPPLAGPLQSTNNVGEGWNGGPFVQQFRIGANRRQGPNPVQNVQNLVATVVNNVAGSGGWPGSPTIVVDPRAGLASTNGYQNRFPNMGGLSYSGGDTRIDPTGSGYAAMPRTREDVRSWISQTYALFGPGGTGWAANGFNDPALY